MLLSWIIYLTVLASSVAFFILYKDTLAFALLLLIAAIPFVMLVIGLITRLMVRISVRLDQTVVTAGEKAHLIITVKNFSPFNTSAVPISGSCQNAFFNNFDELSFAVWAGPFSVKSFDFEIASSHCGDVELYLKRARISDLINLFHFNIRLKKQLTLSVVPKTVALENELSQNFYRMSDSDVFSKSKPGDDPSEVFNIRDFIGGDRLNRIHWKLSTKQEHYMVKDYSLPISENVLILPEFLCTDANGVDAVDTVLELTWSLSQMLLERQIMHSIAWFNCKIRAVQTANISSVEDLYTAIGSIYHTARYYSMAYLANLDPEQQNNASHIVYISPRVTENVCNEIETTGNKMINYTVISVEESNSLPNTASDLNLVRVQPGKVQDGLAGVVL